MTALDRIAVLEASYAPARGQAVTLPSAVEPLGDLVVDRDRLASACRHDTRLVAEILEMCALPRTDVVGIVVRCRSTGVVALAFRGTRTPIEWMRNFQVVPARCTLAPGAGYVHAGFLALYLACRTSVVRAVERCRTVWCLGHSLGAALAALAAFDLAANGDVRTSWWACGSPRIWRWRAGAFGRAVPRAIRVETVGDAIASLPGWHWRHVGRRVRVDGGAWDPHGLAAYRRGLAALAERVAA